MSVVDPYRFDAPDFEVVVVREQDHMLVLTEGELDISTVAAVRAQVLQLAASGCERIVLDLSRLTFADSSQMHLLFELEAAAALDGFAFAVRLGDATPARRVLALTGLEERFTAG